MTTDLKPSEAFARQVLGGCMRERMDAEHILFGSGILESDVPATGEYRAIFRAILAVLRTPQDIPIPEVIALTMGKRDLAPALHDMVSEVGHRSPDQLVTVAKQVITLAERNASYQSVAQAMAKYADMSIPTQDINNELVVELAKVRSAETLPTHMGSLLTRFLENRGAGDMEPIYSSMTWLKYVTNGGLRKRRLYGIAGPDKSRKSTFARNIILSSLRVPKLSENPAEGVIGYGVTANVNAAVLAFENDVETTMFDFIVMIAWSYLWDHGRGRTIANKIWRDLPYSYWLNTELVMTALDNGKIKEWPGEIREALNNAMSEAKSLPIYIYDSNPKTGNLRTADDMTRVLNMHNALYCHATPNKIICVDYNGLVQTPGLSAYEGQTDVVARQLYTANAMDFAVLSLAQYSRGYQTAMTGNGQPKTIGTDNSPALERSVHNYWQVRYDESEPQKLNVMQVRARRGAGGTSGKMQKDYQIQPSTGSIIDEYGTHTQPIHWV